MKINSREHKRVFIIFIGLCVWGLVICGALVRLQVFQYGKNVERVRAQSNRTISLNPKRGTIFDSRGEVMAISVKAKSAFLNNKNILQSADLFKSIRRSISLTYKQIKGIKKRIRRGDKFIWIKRKLSDKEYEALAKIKKTNKSVSALDFLEEFKRVYPQKGTACHILGGVGVDEQGLYGIEYSLDDAICGKPGTARVLRDARRKIFNLKYISRPVAGKDVYLTTDSSIQFFVEKELEKTVTKFNAKGGSVIVMDSHDGSILAMANYPSYQPEMLRKTPAKQLKNQAISFLYHPGSTFKIVLASIALERNVCSPQQVFNCYNGRYKIRDRIITDVHSYDTLTFEGIIIHSSNIGAAGIGEKLGKTKYFSGIRNFGFGRRMGIRLPAEEKGILNPINRWSGVSV
ncbi:MAG: penicillin-binding protein 2, partial [bacterium]|nr:penicillin-binding protein 2 [bacterium]